MTSQIYVCAALLDEEVCLFDLNSAQYLNLNSTGSAIWDLLEEPTELEQIVDALVAKYSIDRHQCLEDTKSFIEGSVAQGF